MFKKIQCEDCEVAALFFYGLPEQKIGHVHLEHIRFSCADEGKKDIPAMMCFIEPVVTDEAEGVAPLMMAYSEMLRI